jgi:alpha-amylase
MFGEVFDLSRPFTSRFTTEDKMQAVLDFPFQDAARNFASKSRPTSQLSAFFQNDDWYTDADSNVYQLPTFLGNHDMGRSS